jgi:hypothetical protein
MNRNPDVDRWLDQADRPLEATMRRARDIIPGADGRVTESIKWKTPTFAYRGNIASFNSSKHLLSIMFHREADIPGEHPRLEGDGRLVRTMRFVDLGELEAGGDRVARLAPRLSELSASGPRPCGTAGRPRCRRPAGPRPDVVGCG